MAVDDLYYLTIAEAGRRLASKELSPVDLMRAHLQRIHDTNDRLNSFITILDDESMAAANAAERAIGSGGYLGPMHGIPVGLKDIIYTKGIRTTVGSRIMSDFVPDSDAAVTERLRAAGAVIVGKVQSHEFALGPTGENPHYGDPRNPWDTGCITGGSSSGSAAGVSSGQVMGALGSDSGGSVRIPASLCGIVGLKPTFGRVSRVGVYPLSFSLDTVGPMTRSAEDAALMLNAIAGHDPRDPSSSKTSTEDFGASLGDGVRGMRIGLLEEHTNELVDPEVKDALSQAARVLSGLGASVEPLSVPGLNDDEVYGISNPILLGEAAEVGIDHLRHRPKELGADVRLRLDAGAMTTAVDYIRAQRARTAFNGRMAAALEKVDLLMEPSTPFAAPRLGQATIEIDGAERAVRGLLTRFTRPFNITGFPAVSLPCGFTSDGLPLGLQLKGRAWAERTVLQAAHAYEQATEWHMHRPPIT